MNFFIYFVFTYNRILHNTNIYRQYKNIAQETSMMPQSQTDISSMFYRQINYLIIFASEIQETIKPKISSKEKTPDTDTGLFPIVGIGASAGGLEALEQFLGNVPDKQRNCLCCNPTSGSYTKRDVAGVASANFQNESFPGKRPYACKAKLRVCNSSK